MSETIFNLDTSWLMDNLAKKLGFRNVICGTGRLARDTRRKLETLGLPVEPYLYGGMDDERAGFRCYERIREIEDVQKCRFWLLYSPEDWYLNAPSLSVIKECVGVMIPWTSHNQIVQSAINLCTGARGDGWSSDIFNGRINSIGGEYFTRGGNSAEGSLKIHIYGASQVADIFAYTKPSLSEQIISELSDLGIEAEVWNFGQYSKLTGDHILRFLYSGVCGKPDLVLFQMTDAKDTDYKVKNPLAIRAANKISRVEYWADREYFRSLIGESNYGIGFDCDMTDISVAQTRIMNVLGGVYGFRFWACIMPRLDTVTARLSEPVSVRSPGYLKRQRERKDARVAAIGEYGAVKDFTDAFDGYDSVFPLLMDEGHMTAAGYVALAKRMTREIAADFPQYIKHNTRG
jgi:hypothetical protein